MPDKEPVRPNHEPPEDWDDDRKAAFKRANPPEGLDKDQLKTWQAAHTPFHKDQPIIYGSIAVAARGTAASSGRSQPPAVFANLTSSRRVDHFQPFSWYRPTQKEITAQAKRHARERIARGGSPICAAEMRAHLEHCFTRVRVTPTQLKIAMGALPSHQKNARGVRKGRRSRKG